jgi:polyisoprenyl-teichoic acid--peptidoglycan teichoic acid transferase
VAWFVANRDRLIGIAFDERFLLAVAAVGLLGVVARLASIAEIAHAYRRSPGIGGQTVVATFVVAALSVPVLLVAYRANDARSIVADVFGSASSDPLFVPQSETSGVDPGSVTNVLLFGGDAGPGRWGMRTDTMILVSVHRSSGRTALVSIPRNLTRLQFPPGSPLAQQFPDGFDDLANAVFTYVNGRDDLVAHYGADGLQPEAVALSQAIGYSLEVQIDDFALVNMAGFSDVIDAVGGVTLELSQSVPLPPDPEGRPLPPSSGPGVVAMDGPTATAYARSRSADSDYERMGRQRQLLAALGSQVSATEAITAFGAVTGVIEDSMRTSLSSGEFSDLLDRLGDNSAIQESVGLTPPLITPGNPDYGQIRSIIDAVQIAVVTGSPSGYSS